MSKIILVLIVQEIQEGIGLHHDNRRMAFQHAPFPSTLVRLGHLSSRVKWHEVICHSLGLEITTTIHSCVPGWKSDENGSLSYNIFIMVFGFVIPLVILVTTSIAKYKHLQTVRRNSKEKTF